ncbi:iron ABC transporter permease [Aeromicrobium camelliae]|uniref:Iron ABC transporter permease n=1 Tax=Aeromicrobium camelliae TaxID=1538144 RepID=A0A3N6YG44_9ACTN|nr:iron ABC transporter permease [Aeromicrobium camelliae]
MTGTTVARSARVGSRSVPVAVLALVLVATMVVALAIGSVHLPLSTVLDVVVRRLGLADLPVEPVDDRIVWQLRMPRVLGAAAVGAGLAIVGVVLQSITRNDLADPYLLGISGGATVGAVSVLVLGFGGGLAATTALTGGAFAGALASLAVVLVVAAGRTGALTPSRTVLAGVAVGQVCAAYTSFVVIFSGEHDAARRVLSWTLGSVAGVRWGSAVFLVVVAIVAVIALWCVSSTLDAFAFGEVAASSLGVGVAAFRWIVLTGTALVVAALVSFSGAIGFVGLVVPHVARILLGPRHTILLPASALGGAILLVWADTVARSLVPGQELPVGVVTAAVGAPLFAYLLWRGART